MIRKATLSDIKQVARLASKVRNHMKSIGLEQWVGDYPNEIHFKNDVERDGLFVYVDHQEIIGSISILPENDPPYQVIHWMKDHALVVHRLFVDPDHQKQGIGMTLFAHAKSMTEKAYQSLKVDTHPDNHRMQALIMKMGFKYMGYIESINRLAYEWVPNQSREGRLCL